MDHLTRSISRLALAMAVALTVGCEGPAGPEGPAGSNGTNGTNGATGTPGTNGTNGSPGAACTVAAYDGGVTVTCPGSNPVNVPNGNDGAACTVANIDGGVTVACPGSALVTVLNGTNGTNGAPPVSTTEKCGICHRSGIDARHAVGNQVFVSSNAIALANADADLLVTFNVKVDGVNRNDFTHLAGVYAYTYTASEQGGRRVSLTLTPAFTVTQAWNGNYRVLLPGFGTAGATPAATQTTFMVTVDTGNSQPSATVVVNYGPAARALVGNQACMNCHGTNVWDARNALRIPEGHRGGTNPQGVEACIVCHNRIDSSETRLGTSTPTDGGAAGTAPGSRLMGYVHGIHNSHNMPAGTLTQSDGGTVVKPAGVYARNGSVAVDAGVRYVASPFSVGFPGTINNCVTCHDSAASLAAVNTAPPSFALCMSCHDNWDGFSKTVATGTFSFHRTYVAGQNCTGACHAAGGAAATLTTAGQFHNGLLSVRSGLIWDAEDQSVKFGKTVAMSIDNVATDGGTVAVTWTASSNDAGVDPCNTNFASGPVFIGAVADAGSGAQASNLSLLRAYAQANDWVNPDAGTSPGQPGSAVNLTFTNTTCSGFVATTIVPAEVTTATKGIVAIQGKPQVSFPAGASKNRSIIQVRTPTPTREFVVATGALPTDPRRSIVDTKKCLGCHNGTLYQHGGNRVDNVSLCVNCHNPAANEKNNRVAMGIDATKAYDGKVGETYSLGYMLHALHSTGETGQPLVYYRSNGIYYFGTKAALDKVKTRATFPWPGEGCQVVAGSTAKLGADCVVTTGVPNPVIAGAYKTHNFIAVEYPRSLGECSACHVDGAVSAVPNPTKAVAVTVDPGASPWGNQMDDVLMGPAAAACMSCHQSGDPVRQFFLRGHSSVNGITPGTFPNGRQTLLDAVVQP